MTSNEHDPTVGDRPVPDEKAPETGARQDPSTNTKPPSNPPVDEAAVEKGKENLHSVVSW